MKKFLILVLTPLLLISCNKDKNKEVEKEPSKSFADYGAFLGRGDNDVSNFSKYEYVSVELNEFGESNISRLTEHGVKFLAYLNIGSLESFREGQEEYAELYDYFSSITFKDYDNWPDERWIDVSDATWQDFSVNTLAKSFKDSKAYGVYLDNVDVYTIAKEEGKDEVAFASGIKNIIKGISNLGLKVMVNGGSEFLETMNEADDDIFNYIWAYQQEEVFSLITDYDNNVFKEQVKEDSEYYLQVASMMKEKGKEVFFLEYTTDENLIEIIEKFCNEKEYHFYISNDVDLK